MRDLLSKLNDDYRPAFLSVDASLLLLRMVAGGFMVTHGWPKLLRLAEGSQSFADPLGLGPEISLFLAAFAEFVCALAVMAGWKMRFALIPLIITMGVAAFMVHAGDPFSSREKALLFMGVYSYLFFAGAGKYTANHILKNRA